MRMLKHVMQSFACAAVALTSCDLAFADVQTVLGRKMKVEDPLPGVNLSKRVVTVYGYERLTPNTIVGNPIIGGATIQVAVTGVTSTRQTFTLPAGPPPQSTGPGWTGKNVPGRGAKFLYVDKNGEASPVTKLVLLSTIGRRFALKARIEAQGNNAPVDIVPGNPTDELGIAVTIGDGDSYCVLFGGMAGGDVIDKDPGKVVVAARPIGEGCPQGVVVGSGCGNGAVDSDAEECDAPDDGACPGQCGSADGLFACLCTTKPRQRVLEHANADLDLGWSGRGHDSYTVGRSYLLDLYDCDGDGTCIVGPSCSAPPHAPCAVAAEAPSGATGDEICAALGQGACRKEPTATGPHCARDIQKKCHLQAPNDAACSAAGDSCVITPHGPPLPLSANGVSVCMVNVFSEDVVGTTNLFTGAAATRRRERAITHLGLNSNTPCPVCGGFCAADRAHCDTDFDCGVAGPCVTTAICSDGPNRDKPCRLGAPFAGETAFFGTTSVDCPPSPSSDISAGGLDVPMNPATTGATTMAPSVPCDAPGLTANACFGGAGEGRPCATASECPGGACGPQCFCPNAGSTLQRPNGCDPACLGGDNDRAPCVSDSECPGAFCHPADCRTDPGDVGSAQEGRCTAGPATSHCAFTTFQPCTSDAECAPPTCSACFPGETCVSSLLQCFVNVSDGIGILRQGAPGVPDRTTAGVTCVPPSANPMVNATYGLPGPVALTQPETVFGP